MKRGNRSKRLRRIKHLFFLLSTLGSIPAFPKNKKNKKRSANPTLKGMSRGVTSPLSYTIHIIYGKALSDLTDKVGPPSITYGWWSKVGDPFSITV